MTAFWSKGFCSQNTQRGSSWTYQFFDPANRFPSCLSIAGDGATGVGGAPHPARGLGPLLLGSWHGMCAQNHRLSHQL